MAYKIKTAFVGGRVKAGTFEKLIKQKRKAAKKMMNRLGNLLYRRVLANVTKSPIPTSTLTSRGSPYSLKHSKIQTSKLGGLKHYQIMTRSGKLAESLDYAVVDSRFGSRQILYIYFKKNAPDYVKLIVKGPPTSKIIHGRDVINETLSRTNKDETIALLRKHLEESDVILTQKDIRKILRFKR